MFLYQMNAGCYVFMQGVRFSDISICVLKPRRVSLINWKPNVSQVKFCERNLLFGRIIQVGTNPLAPACHMNWDFLVYLSKWSYLFFASIKLFSCSLISTIAWSMNLIMLVLNGSVVSSGDPLITIPIFFSQAVCWKGYFIFILFSYLKVACNRMAVK